MGKRDEHARKQIQGVWGLAREALGGMRGLEVNEFRAP